MENINSKVKILCCPNCKGLVLIMPVLTVENEKFFIEKISELNDDFGDAFTINSDAYFNEKNKNETIEYIVDFKYLEDNSTAYCCCYGKIKNIRSFSDACKYLGISDNVPDFSYLPEFLNKRLTAQFKLTIITQAFNNEYEKTFVNSQFGWRKEKELYYASDFFENNDQPFPYAHLWASDEKQSGPGEFMSFFDDGVAMYAGTQFRDLYLDFYQFPETYLNRYKE